MKQKEKLSVAIIAKNAQEYIADAISSVSFANEIIVIDNTSVDNTSEIAKKMGAKVFPYKAKNFADARNYALQKAKGEWILYIDTDERVSNELATQIQHLVNNGENSETVAYKIYRKNFYYGNHEWPYIEKLERLFKKINLKEWYGELHESPKFDGSAGELDGFLFHYTHQRLDAMVEKTNRWSEIEAELRFKTHHPKMVWWRFFRVMITAFFDSYIRQKGWKAGMVGIIESFYQSFSMFVTYAKLWELQKNKIR